MAERVLSKKDFDSLKKLRFVGKLGEIADAELYWVNCMDSEDAVFSQTIKTHSHEFFEIHFVLNGRIVYSFNKGSASVEGGHFLIIPDGEAHTIEGYSNDMLKVSLAVKLGEDEPLSVALRSKGSISYPIDGAVSEAIKFCTDTAQKTKPYKELLIKNRIFELLCHIAGEFDIASLKRDANAAEPVDVRLFKAKQFIKDNPNVFVGCKELARYCNISTKQLNRIFIKYEGMPLLTYIHNEKLAEAKKQLLQGWTLNKISEELGFSSVYYFSRFFTDHQGVSPGTFKKTNIK